MDPKITVESAAKYLDINLSTLHNYLAEKNLSYNKKIVDKQQQIYFSHITSRNLFQIKFKPQIINFQVVKGGTGKTVVAREFAIRANLYGARVLCIDLDQQGNFTQSFNVDASLYPAMIDILNDGYTIDQAIVSVLPGLDVIPSRIENALLDDIIRINELPLDTVYVDLLKKYKKKYDLIVVDCPPNLGQSVVAITLAADQVISPVLPDRFSLAGLEITEKAITELNSSFGTQINYRILLNQYDKERLLADEVVYLLVNHPVYSKLLMSTYINYSQDLPNAVARCGSVFEILHPSISQEDFDSLTLEILDLKHLSKNTNFDFSEHIGDTNIQEVN